MHVDCLVTFLACVPVFTLYVDTIHVYYKDPILSSIDAYTCIISGRRFIIYSNTIAFKC